MEGSKYTNALLTNIDFENWYKLLSNGFPHICDAKHLPPEEMEFLLKRGMKAKLEVPIFIDEKWWGTIGFDDMENEREWTNAEIDILKVAGNVLGAAIKRQIADAALQTELSQRTKLIKELEAKNSELERFTYTVSHDLKAPLVTISGFLGYLEKDMISGDLARFRLDSQRIQDAVNKMRLLLGELLELSRIGRMMNPPQSIPFIDLVNGGVEAVQGLIDMRGIAVQIQPDLPAVYGDRQRLTEVLQNLIDNAAKFMGDQPNPQIEIGQHGWDGGNPIFYVKDNGIGVPQEHYERIFGLFNKLDPNTDGTGIGLALVKRIVEFHGGRIWVESEEGKGSTFYFSLSPG
jgi:signal transduction histidine kinase